MSVKARKNYASQISPGRRIKLSPIAAHEIEQKGGSSTAVEAKKKKKKKDILNLQTLLRRKASAFFGLLPKTIRLKDGSPTGGGDFFRQSALKIWFTEVEGSVGAS